MIRLLDQIKAYPFPNFSCRQVLAILPSQATPYTCKSKSFAAENKDFAYERKGGIGEIKRNEDTVIFGVILIGSAIVRPR